MGPKLQAVELDVDIEIEYQQLVVTFSVIFMIFLLFASFVFICC